MPTSAEKQALVFLTAVSLMGGGVRLWQNHSFQRGLQNASADSAGIAGEGVDDQLAAIDGARASRQGKGKRDVKLKRSTSPKRAKQAALPPVIVDLDVASAEAIESLPHIGSTLAARIVANRDSFGGFGSLNELARVRGINKTIRASIEPQVLFSALPPRTSYDQAVRSPPARKSSARDKKRRNASADGPQNVAQPRTKKVRAPSVRKKSR
jgi:DNA uptake protein ComE-like DNA-binding protein